MSERRYYLELSGRPLEGYKVDEAAEALARLLRVSPQKARGMLRGTPSRIRRDLEEAQALRLMKKVIACGAQCDMTPVPVAASAETQADAADEQPRSLGLELELIEEPAPAPGEADADSAAGAMAADREEMKRSNAFELLDRAAHATEPTAPPQNTAGGAIANATGAAAESPAQQRGGKRRLTLLAVAATLVVAAGIGGWLFLAGSQSPVVVEKPATQVPVENATTRTQRRMKLLARSVRIWMIQYGAGFDPAQVTVQRMQQDLAIAPDDMSDGWGTPLRYIPLEKRFSIVSAGPDAEFDTADDLTITEQARE